jgi:hypothetical protein
MDVRTRYTETLACAAAIIGGPGRLAQFLDVPRCALVRWRPRVAVLARGKP